jgi:hypothetical protein
MSKNYGKKQNAAVKGGKKQFGEHSYGIKGTGVGLTSAGYGGTRKPVGLTSSASGSRKAHGVTSAYLKGQSPYSEKSFTDPRGR